ARGKSHGPRARGIQRQDAQDLRGSLPRNLQRARARRGHTGPPRLDRRAHRAGAGAGVGGDMTVTYPAPAIVAAEGWTQPTSGGTRTILLSLATTRVEQQVIEQFASGVRDSPEASGVELTQDAAQAVAL